MKNKTKKRPSHLRQSKTDGFLEHVKDNTMVDYFNRLKIINPAAELNEPRREGGFVRLAHAREEFTAPVLTKGKAATRARDVMKKKQR